MNEIRFERRGLLLVISAPSGGGKSSILKELFSKTANLAFSISTTSRSPRADEVNGREYDFVSRERFEEMVAEQAFYEWAEVHGNLYGTKVASIEYTLSQGIDIVLDIDIQGALFVKNRTPDAILVFIMPPSLEVLESRLRGRQTDHESQILLRLENASKEMTFWDRYDYVVVNDKLEHTVNAVRHILEAERMSTKRLAQC